MSMDAFKLWMTMDKVCRHQCQINVFSQLSYSLHLQVLNHTEPQTRPCITYICNLHTWPWKSARHKHGKQNQNKTGWCMHYTKIYCTVINKQASETLKSMDSDIFTFCVSYILIFLRHLSTFNNYYFFVSSLFCWACLGIKIITTPKRKAKADNWALMMT